MDGSLTNTPMLRINRHPILIDAQTTVVLDLIPGESLFGFLHRHIDNLDDQPLIVLIGGVEIPREHWMRVKPKDGYNIEVRFTVGRTALFIVAMIALTVFTMGAAAAVAAGAAGAAAGTGVAAGFAAGMAAAGLSAAAQLAVIGAVQVVGAMVINKVLGPKPPKAASMDRDSVFNISGSRNALRQYEPLGLLLADDFRVAPDVISIPYSYYKDNDQYVAMVLSPGINVHSFGDLYIGDTLLSTYEGVRVWTAGFPGMPEDNIPVLSNVDQVAGGELEAEFNVPGNWMVRTTSLNTMRIQVDITFLLFDKTNKGKDKDNQETIEVQFRAVGSADWQLFQTIPLRSDKTTAQRRSYARDVPQGQYEVRMRRMGRDTDGSGATANFQWATLTSIQVDEATYVGIPRIAIEIKATGQLSGTPDQIRAAMRIKPMPFWDGNQWTTTTNRATGAVNNGTLALQFIRGFRDETGALAAGMGLPESLIDLESFKEFMVHCRVNNFSYNKWISEARNCDEVLSEIMAAGMGRYTWAPGKLTALWVAPGQAAQGVVTMANIKKGEFQVDYSLMQSADGIEFTYADRDANWEMKTLRVPLPGVLTMENPARIPGEGIDNLAQAAIIARWHMGQNLYQFKDIVYGQDLEHLAYGQWDIVQLSHDLTQWGYSGRLMQMDRDVNGVVVMRLDTPVPGTLDGQIRTPYVGLRIPTENNYRVFKVKEFGDTRDTLVLDTAWPVDAPFPGTPGNPVHDTIFLYDFKQTPGLRCRVVALSPADDLGGATVSVVPESDEFWNYVLTGEYIPPKNESLLRPQAQISNLRVREERVVQGDTIFSRLNATWQISGYAKEVVVVSGMDGELPVEVWRGNAISAAWRVDRPGRYYVTVRPFGDDGVPGVAQVVAVDVYGADLPPVNADNFYITEVAGGLRRYSWGWNADTIQSPDFAGVEIRYIAGQQQAPVWDAMTPLAGVDGDPGYHAASFETTVPASGIWTFALRGRNTSGILSLSLRIVTRDLDGNLGEVISGVEQDIADETGWRLAADLAESQARIAAFNQLAADLLQETNMRLAADEQIADEAREYTDNQVAALNSLLNDIIGADEWNNVDTYQAGGFVQHNGYLWRANVENTNVEPGTDGTWTNVGEFESVGEALAAAISMATQNATDISAQATRVDAVVAQLPANGEMVATAASVAAEEQARVAADEAQAQSLVTVQAELAGKASTSVTDVLTTKVTDHEGRIATNTSAITSLRQDVDGKASNSALQTLQGNVEVIDGRVNANTVAITNLGTRVDGKADATAVSTLSTRVDAAEGNISSQGNAITQLTNQVAGKADASAVQGLTTRVTVAEGKIETQGTAITGLTSTVANKADASAVQALNTRVNVAEGNISSLSTAITNVTASLNENPNMLLNSTWADAGAWWSVPAGSAFLMDAASGPFLNMPVTAGTGIAASQNVATNYANVRYWFCADAYLNDASGAARLEIISVNSAGTTLAANTISASNATLSRWQRVQVWLDVPAGTANMIVRCISEGKSATTSWRRAKLEMAPQPTPWNNSRDYDNLSSATTALSATVNNHEGRITANASAITAVNAALPGKANASVVQTLDARVSTIGGGGNLLKTAIFGSGLRPWATGAAVGNWSRDDTSLQDFRLPKGLRAMNMYSGQGQAETGYYLETYQDVPIEYGKYYLASAYLLPYGVRAYVSMIYIDSAGNGLPGGDGGQITAYQASSSLKDYGRSFVKTQAPFGAVTARMSIWIVKTAVAAADAALWVVQPMLEEARADQTQPSMWSAGGAEASAEWKVVVQADNKLGGVRLGVAGGVSAFDINADIFRVTSSTGGSRLEWFNGGLRTYDGVSVVVAMGTNI